MRAVRLLAWERDAELVEIPVPIPRGREVLLRVEAVGLCHSDLHVMDAPSGTLPYRLPFTLGHETAGTVAAVGDEADAAWVGEPVVVHGIWSCGQCRNCVRGRNNYCLRLAGGPIGGGLGHDGGLADYALVPGVGQLVRRPGLAARDAAPLTDAGLTAFHALSGVRDLAEGGTVLVLGVGGLGHMALQYLAALTGTRVVAVDTRPEARAHARRLGAEQAVASPAEAGALLAESGGADVVLDFVGARETLAAVPGLLAPGGAAAIVGSGGGETTVGKGGGLPSGWRLSAPFWGPRDDLAAVVRLAVDGVGRPTTSTYSLDQALDAYRALRSGRVEGRAVVVP
ncbi:alcohol dehydrogenase catalytic domain-containing protein [Cryptosporangium sp. NPDC051539]|uniref:alcohol dehydrogenase catalytic domain-containing protein n=1 Tax=Cryptosporangium sp. NPDC051539 TaxID=3363962 RepID=UPI00378EE096